MEHTDPHAKEQARRYVEACGEYTSEFEKNKLIDNWAVKEKKADGLVADFKRRAGDPQGKRVLEVGFGSGLYLTAFAKAGAHIHGIEVNDVLLDIARENMQARGFQSDLQNYDGEHFPYPDEYFDYVFMISVLEHVSKPYAVMHEIDRVLKKGGRAYISFPNRLAPKETHSGVWFISYLPHGLAEWVFTKILHRDTMKELNLHFVTYWSLRSYLHGTRLRVLFETNTGSLPRRLFKKVCAALGMHHSAVLKTVMPILEKR